MPARDMAENLEALFEALGAVDQVNAIGTVATTAANNLPDPTVQAVNTATLSTSGQASFVLPTASVGKRIRLYLIQDTTGSRTAAVTTSAGALKWVGAGAPTLTTTGGHADLLEFECFVAGTWVGSSKLNIN